MKTFRVEFTPDAHQDIIAYAQYIAKQEKDDSRALAWYEGMHATVMGLATMPDRHGFARENDDFEDEVRQVVYASHRIIYSVHENDGLVAIHRIWHVARELAGPDDLPQLKSND